MTNMKLNIEHTSVNRLSFYQNKCWKTILWRLIKMLPILNECTKMSDNDLEIFGYFYFKNII